METGNRKILIYRPVTVWMAVVAGVLSMLALGWLIFEHGTAFAARETHALYKQRSRLQQRIDQLQQAQQELQEQLAIWQRSSEIDRLASLDVRDEFARLQDELLGARKELDFYRGIVSPGDVKPGLRIQSFQVEQSQDARYFAYRLTLVQVKQNEKFVSGTTEINIEGTQDNELKMLLLTDLATDGKKAIGFRFRYFQHFEGQFELPAGFRPQRVRVRVKPRGKGQPKSVEQFIDWPGYEKKLVDRSGE